MDSSSSSSLKFNDKWIYDVFVSYLGKDTGQNFVSHLQTALTIAGITTCINYRIGNGTELGPELSRAIGWSRISILVFSRNYTQSSWCLNELQKVMECHRTGDQAVVPVFYDVDPSVVRLQNGGFGKDLRATAKRISAKGKMEHVLSSWRKALTEAANLLGWDATKYRYKDELVQRIVEDVLRKLNRGLLNITKFPVGLHAHVQQVIQFIENQSSKVCLIGIWGMGGLGKTTTARAVYNQIHYKFDDLSFIENIREVCTKGDGEIIHLQEQPLSNVLETNEKIHTTYGISTTEKRFIGKKVLIVLDDVSTFGQVEALCGNRKCYGLGSVLIVTTRDKRILNLLKVDRVFSIEEMDTSKSLELFCWHAFRQPSPIEDFRELSKNVVAYCGGLPVALEVLGSSLYERTEKEWISVLSKLKRTPNDRVQEKLRISYDSLKDDMTKDIFLDICCFFIGKDKGDVTEILNNYGLYADVGIAMLVECSLLKVEKNDKLGMHDLIRDMGREIVRGSSQKEPGKRSRLWLHEDVHDVLTTKSGTEAIQGLVLKSERTGRIRFSTDSFKEMKKLRLLELDRVDLTGDYGNLSKELRWVHWQGFSLNYIPDEFYQGNLVVIDLKFSNIKKVWNKTQVLVNLKILNLSHSRYLNRGPDFSKLPNLEKLIMMDCPSLSKIHPSIGDLNNLLLINLKDCTGLSHLPKKIYQLKSLETLILSGCSKLDKLEEDIVQLESLTTLIAKGTSVKHVPYSILRLKSIGYISLCGHEGLSREIFPSLISSWMSPTMNSLPQISPFRNITYYLASIAVQKNNPGFLSPTVSSLLRLRTFGVQFRSKIELTQELRRILDDQYDIRFTKVETSQFSNLSLRSLLIGMGSFHKVIDTLSKSILQGLTTKDSGEYFLPGDNYPSWLVYKGEGPSVKFQVPEDSDYCMKGITLCAVYSSTSENMATECLTSVSIINYNKFTVHIYKRDTIMSFNDEDWKNVASNLGPGDNVEIFVAFGHGLIVKKVAVYLLYYQSIDMDVSANEKDGLMNDVGPMFKGGLWSCDYKKDMDETSKRYQEILNQSENAVEIEVLGNDVDVNKRLASAAFHEYGQIYDVMDELEKLKNSVECIRFELLDAQEKQEQYCAAQSWIRSLEDVLHLADDLLDEFIIEGMRYKVNAGDKKKMSRVFRSLSSNHTYLRRTLVPKFKKIKKMFDDMVEEMAKLNLGPKAAVVKHTDSLRNKSVSFLLESDIIGREDEKKEIINLLRQPRRNISSIAIVGMGGIGKTALAQFVYNDVEVQNHFEKKMWVCVSPNFDVKTIVKKMLESLTDSKIDDKLSIEYIQHKLHENLAGERYLLVLDNIWNASHEKWTQLRTYLMCGAEDSKVLMTTRDGSLAERLEASDLYFLSGLTLDVSWSILKKMIFRNETDGVDQKLESIGIQIAEECMGHPLLIRTLGGLLQSKSEEMEWIDVLREVFLELGEHRESIIPHILKMSYQSLSPRLRQCFAYCSLFPKDWEIEKDLLIQLWMAQGYLQCSDEKEIMEDTGEEFVKIFLMRSFFQDVKVGEDGEIVSFKMHDLMHDLAIAAAGNDCCYLDSETNSCVQRPMHVSLEPNAVHLLDSFDGSRLRTLILLSSNEEELNEDKLSVISKFKQLRVLKLSNCSLSKSSRSIGKMKHLRYLNLSNCRGLGSLYKSLSSLVLLQTLTLTPNEKVELFTKVVSKLINLRHLHISDWEASRDRTPFGFVQLSIWQHKRMNISNWLSPLTNIVEISFFLCGSLQFLPPLERLPFLKSLHIGFLEELEYIYYEQDFSSVFFPSLKSLSLQFCYKLRGWRKMGDDFNNTNSSQNLSLPTFPRLSQLSIIGCLKLTCMPAFPSLENGLEWYDSSVETLVATLNNETLNGFPALSMLKSLHIDGVSLDVKSIPSDWMKNLTSLQFLHINWFSPQTFRDTEAWFENNSECLPCLQIIGFHNCEEIEVLPDWICNLSSLQHLKMHDCINLASLPNRMSSLTNLQTLEIIGCPLLVEECQKQTGETWDKICDTPLKHMYEWRGKKGNREEGVRIERRDDEVGGKITNYLGGSKRVEEGIEEISEHTQKRIKGNLTYGVRHSRSNLVAEQSDSESLLL
ncbi:uncharacterized protein LOC131616377 [Vicia villosa]|uniref:uncharacterized protein LOC131616377 n=1 Tax=Vicia villosa TaxID=3911 RepID=UPI00273AC061|nr:uncharacterized protein LOC131616377 [Vicia villosa]